MGRFILGIVTVLVLLAAVFGILFTLGKSGVIDLKQATIGFLGRLPGWGDLPEIFSAGKKETVAWREKEKTYQASIEALNRELAKVRKELEKVRTDKTLPPPKENKVKPPPGAPAAAPAKSEPDLAASRKHAARLLAEMTPEAAAQILLRMPPQEALAVLDKMENRKAAKIIEAMPVENGSALVTKLAENR